MPIGAAVQPRVCGERDDDPHLHQQDVGSAPRVRGTAVGGATWRHDGSAPRVRGTGRQPVYAARAPVQPRVCGERPA